MTQFTDLNANIETAAPNHHDGTDGPTLALLRSHIKETRPDTVTIQQAYRAGPWLRTIEGYRLRQYGGRESRGIAVLIRAGITIEHRRALVMREKWTGPKAGLRHDPRTYPAFRLRLETGEVVRLLAVHQPTHNNAAAQVESITAIRTWFDRSDAPSLAVGDWNLTDAQVRAAVGPLAVLSTGKVDHAVTDAEKGIRHRLETAEGCHGWGLFGVTL